jgi:hypothetical protein
MSFFRASGDGALLYPFQVRRDVDLHPVGISLGLKAGGSAPLRL